MDDNRLECSMSPSGEDAQASPPASRRPAPASFWAAASALEAIRTAIHEVHAAEADGALDPADGPGRALDSLRLLRETREELAGWESALIETARAAGASWADLAGPLGVASRQAAERRYLRLRPGAADTTGDQRVQAVRDRRAADRTVTTWARENASTLRQLAGQIIGLTDLPAGSHGRIDELNKALAHHDAARLVEPLSATQDDLHGTHGDLARRVEAVKDHTRRLRSHSDRQRGA
ncbi:type III effector protein [Streptomyces sp. NPDC012794]|uniref:type III effector protein n=1 Tax=Streptomyces sp. NPDC012794 TaxID=3364850 RepID=UPI0036BA0FCF